MFVELAELEHFHAVGVFNSITDGLKSVDLSMENLSYPDKEGPTLAYPNFDGAAAMTGKKTARAENSRTLFLV